jgi:hypothetical protein
VPTKRSRQGPARCYGAKIGATRVKRCIAVSAWLSSVPKDVHDGIFGAMLALLPKR